MTAGTETAESEAAVRGAAGTVGEAGPACGAGGTVWSAVRSASGHRARANPSTPQLHLWTFREVETGQHKNLSSFICNSPKQEQPKYSPVGSSTLVFPYRGVSGGAGSGLWIPAAAQVGFQSGVWGGGS